MINNLFISIFNSTQEKIKKKIFIRNNLFETYIKEENKFQLQFSFL